MTWLSGWNKREPIVIAGDSNLSSLYHFALTIHYGYGTNTGLDIYLHEQCAYDFSDVRVAQEDGTLCDIFLLSKTNNNNAVLAVKAPSTLNNRQTLYLYYVNQGVASAWGDNANLYTDLSYIRVNSGTSVYLHNSAYGAGVSGLKPTVTIDSGAKKITITDLYLDNDREESNVGLTDGQSDSNEICIYDDVETFWTCTAQGIGGMGISSSGEDTLEKVKGTSSYKIVFTSGSYSQIQLQGQFALSQDWSSKEFIGIYVFGLNSGASLWIGLFDGVWENYQFATDNFSGWRRFVIPLTSWTTVNKSALTYIKILYGDNANPAPISGSFRVDRTVVDVGQWVKVETYVPNILVDPNFTQQPTWDWKVVLYCWTGSVYSPFSVGPIDSGYGIVYAGYIYALNGQTFTNIYGGEYNAKGALYGLGERTQEKTPFGDANAGNITYSNNYGALKRIGFALKMPPDDGQDSSTAGISQVKLKLEIYYA